MTSLNISVLGKLHIQQNGRSLPGFVARKSQALLCYLAFTGQPHSRQALAGLLWSEMDEDKARRNLRVALTRMKDVVAEHLVIQRRTLAFNKERPYQLDVTQFESTLKQKNLSIDTLKQATDLYRGPFLDDFFLRDAPLFDEWVRLQQEHYRQMAMDGLYRLSALQTEAQQFNDGINTLNRLLKLEPWMEEAHRQLMLLLAVSGQRTAALAQYETCATLLAEELGVEPAGETTTLYQKIRAEDLDDLLPHLAIVPTPTPKPPPPFQVPAAIPHFVGRTEQQNAIAQTLQDDKATAVHAIVGMGGVGKSTLAAQIATQLQGHFPDGVLWANASISEPVSVLESWTQLYGYDFSALGDVHSMSAAFRSTLAEKRVLLVLDDVTSAARIRPLLPSGPHCRVLLTMRDQDLARMLNAQVWPLHELSEVNGRLLFRRILGETRVEAEPDAAASICDELANLPLAVEITAQRLKSRPRRKLADWANRLRDEKKRLSLLTISDREVRASFALSWETLDRNLKRVFALLGLFAERSFAAEAVANIAEMDAYLLEDRLYALVSLSLLREEGQTRYQLHPLLADFAREQLGENIGEMNGRFAHYYLHFAQQNQANYDALRPEWDNLMAALEAAHTQQLWQTVIHFADALHDAWFKRGRFTQARQAYERIHTAAQIQENNTLISANLLRWGLVCIEQNDYEEAAKHLNQHLTHLQEGQDEQAIAIVKYHLARISLEQNQFEEAEQLLEESLTISKRNKDFSTASGALFRKARIYYKNSNYVQAKKLATEAQKIQETTNNQQGMIPTLRLLAQIELANEQFDLASQHIQKAQKYVQQLNDQGERVATLYVQLGIQRRQKNYEQSLQIAHEGIHLAKRLGLQMYEALYGYDTCLTHMDLGNYNKALELWPRYSKLLQEVGNLLFCGLSKMYTGDSFKQIGQPDQALNSWQEARQIAISLKHKPLLEWVEARLTNTH